MNKEKSPTDKNQRGYKGNTKVKSNNGTLTKKQIFEAFEGKITESAIRRIDEEWQIAGKFCRVSWIRNSWDVFICNSACINAGLGQRKVTNIVHRLEEFNINQGFTILSGEAFSQDVPKKTILKCLFILGIRKSRTLSPEQRVALSERMKKIRRAA